LLGENEHGRAENCFWDKQKPVPSSSKGGAGRTTKEMVYPHAANTYRGWDFRNVWVEDSTGKINGGLIKMKNTGRWQSLSRIWLTFGLWAAGFTNTVLAAKTPEAQTAEEGMPIWLQILLPIGIALLIYFIIQGLARRRNMKKEEIVFHKEVSGMPESSRSAPPPAPKPEKEEWTFPERDEKTGETIKLPKGANWGMVVFALAILKALSRCLQ
jgi:hypothetical protein